MRTEALIVHVPPAVGLPSRAKALIAHLRPAVVHVPWGSYTVLIHVAAQNYTSP